jgi:DNA helicase-2/ATP-dependent DNA helicase PcrA
VASINFPSDYALGNILRSGFYPTKYLKRKEIQDHIKSVQKMDSEKSAWAILNEYRPSDPNQVKAVGTLISFIHSLRRFKDLRPQAAVQQVIQALHAYDAVEEDGIDNSPTENLQELVRMSARFSSIKDFITFVFKATAASKSTKGISLSTVHGAKGLEWPVVFLVSVCDGVLPHSKAESLADEKNIFFVGCSRAEKELYISYAGSPSQFLKPFIKSEEEKLEEVFA